MRRFFDTNVVVYAFTDDPKSEAARGALAQGGIISAQVLNEFTNVARRKLKREWPEIERAIEAIHRRFPDIAPVTRHTHAIALGLAREGSFAFYDALIVAAAHEAGCDTLISGDMQEGRSVLGLTIRNPFAASLL